MALLTSAPGRSRPCPPAALYLDEGGRLMTLRALPPLLIVAGSPVPCTRCCADIPAAAFEYPYWTKARHSLLA